MNSQDRLIHFVLISLLLYSAASFCSSGAELRQARSLEQGLISELELLEAENSAMAKKLEAGITEEELIQLARQRLGLVLPGEKIFYFTTDREA